MMHAAIALISARWKTCQNYIGIEHSNCISEECLIFLKQTWIFVDSPSFNGTKSATRVTFEEPIPVVQLSHLSGSQESKGHYFKLCY